MIAQISTSGLWLVIGGFAITWIALIIAWVSQRNELAAFRNALKVANGRPIDRMLEEHLESRNAMEGQIADLQRRLKLSEDWMDKAISYASIVRYDAFDNVTGNQSFAVALQNSQGDGILLNAVSGRDQARIYGKSVKGGVSDGNLTPEEKQAIINALNRSQG